MTPLAHEQDIARAAPHNVEAEQALLGAILVNNEAFYRVCDFLKPEHFFEPIHQTIYELAGNLVRAGKVANPITLKDFLPTGTVVGNMNASQYIARLAAEAITIVNAKDYGELVHDLALRRGIIEVARDALSAAYDSPAELPPRQLLEEVEQQLYQIGDAARRDGARDLVSADEAVCRAIDAAAKAYQADGRVTGVTWGLADLDRMTTGLHAGEMVLLAGRPGMGKSAVGIAVADSASRWTPPGDPTPTGVLLVSPEMTAQAIGGRLVTSEAKGGGSSVPYSALRSGRFGPDDFDRMAEAAKHFSSRSILIDETATITIAGVASAVRRAALRFRRKGIALRLVVVDYLQLVAAGDRYRGKRVDEVAEISAGLKQIARNENVAVLALSQLSRDLERREDKRPQLSDLRDSGSLEQDADAVVFAFREEYYLGRGEPTAGTEEHFKWQAALEACHGRMELIIGKQRHGPIGKITVRFDAPTNVVRDLSHDECMPERLL